MQISLDTYADVVLMDQITAVNSSIEPPKELAARISVIYPHKRLAFTPLTSTVYKILSLKIFVSILLTLGLIFLSETFRTAFSLYKQKASVILYPLPKGPLEALTLSPIASADEEAFYTPEPCLEEPGFVPPRLNLRKSPSPQAPLFMPSSSRTTRLSSGFFEPDPVSPEKRVKLPRGSLEEASLGLSLQESPSNMEKVLRRLGRSESGASSSGFPDLRQSSPAGFPSLLRSESPFGFISDALPPRFVSHLVPVHESSCDVSFESMSADDKRLEFAKDLKSLTLAQYTLIQDAICLYKHHSLESLLPEQITLESFNADGTETTQTLSRSEVLEIFEKSELSEKQQKLIGFIFNHELAGSEKTFGNYILEMSNFLIAKASVQHKFCGEEISLLDEFETRLASLRHHQHSLDHANFKDHMELERQCGMVGHLFIKKVQKDVEYKLKNLFSDILDLIVALKDVNEADIGSNADLMEQLKSFETKWHN